MRAPDSLLLIALCTVVFFDTVTAYDIRCVYPRELGEDLFTVERNAVVFITKLMRAYKFETPMVVRFSQHATTCQSMCLSLHDEHVLDPYSMQPTDPVLQVPVFGQSPYSASMCYLQCIIYVFSGVFDFQKLILEEYNGIGVNLVKASARLDIADALGELNSTGDSSAIEDILFADDYHPYTMGHIAGVTVKQFMDVDGWNANGDLKWSSDLQRVESCTSNCRKYQSTIGYTTAPDPRKLPFYNRKYECKGICRNWQPLQEGDDAGNMKRQEHIVPHIGKRAITFLREATLTLDDPAYNLYEESLLVIERLRQTASNQYMKDAIKIMDNKLKVRSIIELALKDQFEGALSFQDHLLFLTGIGMAEYDGIVQAWHEKVNHDIVRPTTVIKHWGNDALFTFGGNPSVMHPVNITASDFEAFLRVMPHAEFPSGSACLCTAYYEFTDIFTNEMYGSNLTNIPLKGHNDMENLEELRDICAESRLWAGLHYTASVPAGIETCSGLGQLAFDFIKLMKNNATYAAAGGPWYKGDTLGVCPP